MATSTVFSSGFSPVLHAQAADDFLLLSAAASKAEEAASRYENNTAGLLQTKNSSLRKDITETSYLSANCQFPLKAAPTFVNSLKSIQGMGRDDSIQDSLKSNDCGLRPLAPKKPNSSAPERSLNPATYIEASRDGILAPSLNAKTPRNTDSLSNKKVSGLETQKNWAHMSSARISRSQSLSCEAYSSNALGQTIPITTEGTSSRKSIDCLPLKDKLVDQKRQHKPPTAVIERMSGVKPVASEFPVARSRSEISEPVKAKEVPTTRSSQPQTSPMNLAGKGALNTPRQTSDIRRTKSPMSDAVKTTNQPMKNSSVQNPGQSTTTPLNTMPRHLADDLAFMQIFKNTIYNPIRVLEKNYRGRLPEDILLTIGKSVANQVVTPSLRNLVRECSYNLNEEQKKKVETTIESLYNEKVAGSIAGISLANGRSTLDQHPSKTVHDELNALSRTLSTRSSVKKFASPRLYSAQSLPSADSPVVPKDVIADKSTANPAHGNGDIFISSPSDPRSPKSMFGGAKASPDRAIVGNRRFGPSSPRHGLSKLSEHSVLPESKVSSAVDPSVVGAQTGYVDGRMKLPDRATEIEPPPSSLKAIFKSEPEDGDQKPEQRVALIDTDRSVEQNPDPGTLSRQNENVQNRVVNPTNGQLNLDKHLFAEFQPQNKHDQKLFAIHDAFEDDSSEEDGAQVLASWLTIKPTKQIVDQEMPNRLTEESLVPRDSREKSFSGGTRSSPATSFHNHSHKTKSPPSSPTEDPSFTPPQPKQDSSPTRRSRLLRPALLPEISGSFVSPNDADRAPSKEAIDCATTIQAAKSVELPKSTSSSERHDAPYQGQEKLAQGQNRTSQPPDRPFSFPSRSFRQSTRSFASSTNAPSPPVILPVGRPFKQDDPDLVKTLAELALHQPSRRRPYNSKKRERDYSREECTKIKHVDFSKEECEELMQAWLFLDSPIGSSPNPKSSGLGPKFRRELQESLQTASPAEMSNFVQYLDEQPDKILRGRSSRAIKSFLWDLVEGRASTHPKCIRVEVQHVDPCHHPLRTTASLLRQRELGILSGRGFRNVKTELQLKTSQKLSPYRSWKGASGDVVACAWAPSLESSTFAVGAAAHTDEQDLQYNRPRNLLLGNMINNTLQELPDHRIPRPLPNTISQGPNADQAVYDACDPMVYTTVSSLQFSIDGRRLYTASHDKTVKIWDVSSSSCIKTLHHDALVSELDVSNYFRDVFAAATKTIANSIHVYFPESDDSSDLKLSCAPFESPRAKSGRKGTLFPGCVRWGRTPNTSRLLLAGFQQWGGQCDSRAEGGEICLWDVQAGVSVKVSPGVQSVFAATWHPTLDLFAIGGGAGRNRPLTHPTTTRTVVRTWDVRSLPRYTVEYECPAMDMQDVTFNPSYPNIVTAGCTDSATYVWDFRKPEHYLHRLQHGRPLLDWEHNKSQEEGDPGVMMTLWGMEGALLYTGSSDGIVKSWDIMRAPEDVHVGDIGDLGAGVQSGAFSPDFSHLLVGDSDGGVHILSSAPVEGWADTGDQGRIEPIEFIQARDVPQTVPDDDNPGTEGIEAATELLDSGCVMLDPRFGAGQGPNYRGPYARHARVQTEEALPLRPEFEALQPFSSGGQENLSISRTRQNLMEERRRLIEESGGEKCVDETGSRGIKLESEEGERVQPSGRSMPVHKKRDREDDSKSPRRKKQKWAIVDLCTPPPDAAVEGEEDQKLVLLDSISSPRPRPRPSHGSQLSPMVDVDIDNNDIPESEMIEENHWWPRMDEEVFVRLKKRQI